MITILLVVMILIAMISSAIARGFAMLNRYDIKHRAQRGDRNAKLVFPFFELKYQLLLVAAEINIIAITASIILVSDVTKGFVTFLASVLLIFITGELVPLLVLRHKLVVIIARLSPLLHKMIIISGPVNSRLANVLGQWAEHGWNMVYSREQLIKMLEGFRPGRDGDLSVAEVRMMRQVLSFSDKKIRDVMTPRRMVHSVSADTAISPQLLTDLYASGHSRFPVVAKPGDVQFIGTLYIRDLVNHRTAKNVKDVMHEDVLYMHEELSLDYALRAFLKSRHHLYIIVNSFEEFVGVLSLEDVLEEIIGKEIVDEFDQHGDLRAVAQMLAKHDAQHRQDP